MKSKNETSGGILIGAILLLLFIAYKGIFPETHVIQENGLKVYVHPWSTDIGGFDKYISVTSTSKSDTNGLISNPDQEVPSHYWLSNSKNGGIGDSITITYDKKGINYESKDKHFLMETLLVSTPSMSETKKYNKPTKIKVDIKSGNKTATYTKENMGNIYLNELIGIEIPDSITITFLEIEKGTEHSQIAFHNIENYYIEDNPKSKAATQNKIKKENIKTELINFK